MKVELTHRENPVTLDVRETHAQITMRAADYFNGWCGEARSFLDVKKDDEPSELFEAIGEVASLVGIVAVTLMAMAAF